MMCCLPPGLSPDFSEPPLFYSPTPTPGVGTHADLLVLANGRKERVGGISELSSLLAMFHPSTI